MTENTNSGKRGYRPWTDEDVDKLRRFANLGASTIATALNRPKTAIYNKAKALGIDVTRKAQGDTGDAAEASA